MVINDYLLILFGNPAQKHSKKLIKTDFRLFLVFVNVYIIFDFFQLFVMSAVLQILFFVYSSASQPKSWG